MGIMSIRKSVKKLFAPVVVILIVGLTVGMFYIGFPEFRKETWGYKGPSAKVFGKVINDKDFNSILLSYQQQAMQYPNQLSQADLREQALNRAITDKAFMLEVEKAGSKVKSSSKQVNDFIKERWPTEEELQGAIRQFGKSNKSEFVSWLREQFTIRNFIIYKCRELKMTVSKEKVLATLEKITVSHILIGTKDPSGQDLRTEAQALQIANDVYKKATAAGAVFASLAKEYSDDPGSKEKGGTYGPYPVDQFKNMGFVKEFVDGALALKVGEISKPVKTQFGYHILKLDAKGLPEGKQYEKEYKESEENLLYSMTQDPSSAFSKWHQEMNANAIKNTEILDPGLRAYRLAAEKKWQEAAEAYEKAFKRSYYKDKVEMYIDASNVYIELKDAKSAIEVLKKTPGDLTDTVDYQIALAKAYKANDQIKKALDGLSKYSSRYVSSQQESHLRLKQLYTEWNLPDLAEKEGKIVNAIVKKEEEDAKKYQEELERQEAAQNQSTSSEETGE